MFPVTMLLRSRKERALRREISIDSGGGAGRPAAAAPQRALSSKCEQCHDYS